MSYPWFPAELGRPVHSGFNDTFGDGRRRTRPEYGMRRTNRKFSAVEDLRSYSFFWTVSESMVFERFYLVTINEGYVPFWMNDPVRDALPLTDQTGRILTDHLDRPFLSAAPQLLMIGDRLPDRQPKGDGYTISFSVEKLPV
jgi:hypothetical protein